VKFKSDTIDETDLLEETLKPRVEFNGGTLEKVQLSGNHITPCIQVYVFFYDVLAFLKCGLFLKNLYGQVMHCLFAKSYPKKEKKENPYVS